MDDGRAGRKFPVQGREFPRDQGAPDEQHHGAPGGGLQRLADQCRRPGRALGVDYQRIAEGGPDVGLAGHQGAVDGAEDAHGVGHWWTHFCEESQLLLGTGIVLDQ